MIFVLAKKFRKYHSKKILKLDKKQKWLKISWFLNGFGSFVVEKYQNSRQKNSKKFEKLQTNKNMAPNATDIKFECID